MKNTCENGVKNDTFHRADFSSYRSKLELIFPPANRILVYIYIYIHIYIYIYRVDRLGGSSLTGGGFGGIRIANKTGECLHVVAAAAAASPSSRYTQPEGCVYTQRSGKRDGEGRRRRRRRKNSSRGNGEEPTQVSDKDE